jgi:type IV fimbrial biogenesis protein FimT
MTHRSARGFSLLELMTVLAVLGIVMAFSVPSYVNYTATQNLSGSASNIAAQLRLAREKAISTGQNQTMHFTLNYSNSDYHIHNTTVEAKWDLPRNILYYWGTGTVSAYTFTSDGRCNTSGLVIVQDPRGLRDTVSVQRSGFVMHQ